MAAQMEEHSELTPVSISFGRNNRPRAIHRAGEAEGTLLDAIRDGVLDGMQYFDAKLEKLV